MATLRASFLILRKDLRLRLRDRSIWVFALAIPLALTVVFSLLFRFDDVELHAGVVDLDGGAVANSFIGGLLPALVDEGFLTTVLLPDEASARAAMEDGTISAAWVIPERFTDRVTQGQGAALEVLVNPDRQLAGEVARGIAGAFGAELERVRLAVATSAAATQGALDAEELEQLASQVSGSEALVSVEGLVAPDRQLEPTSYLAAGMAIFFLFFTVTFGITGLLEEREQGTLPRLLSAPIAPIAVQLGKALGAFLVGILSMVVLAVAAELVLDAPWGPPLGVGILIVAAVIAALGVMALVGSFARTTEQAGNLQSGAALVLGLLGGVFFPLGAGFLGTLAVLSPHGWFLRGLGDLAGEQVWTAVLPAAGALLVFGIATAVPGLLRIRTGGD